MSGIQKDFPGKFAELKVDEGADVEQGDIQDSFNKITTVCNSIQHTSEEHICSI